MGSEAEQDLPSKKDRADQEDQEAEADAESGNDDKDKAEASAKQQSKLTSAQQKDLVKWLERTLSAHVSAVKVSHRLVSSPAIITDHESASVRRLMHMMGDPNLSAQRKQKLEINPSHPIMVRLATVAKQQPHRAAIVAEQACHLLP
jgi:HSP90 family molecular chaperone